MESKNRRVHRDFFVKLAKAHEINLDEGDFVIIPGGAGHELVADGGAYFLLFERRTAMIIGKVRNEKTVFGTAGLRSELWRC